MKKNTYFAAKLKHLNIKAPSNNVKIQSDENLTTQVYLIVTTKHMSLYINETK